MLQKIRSSDISRTLRQRRLQDRLFHLFTVWLLTAAYTSSPAHAVALLSDEFELYLPWTQFRGQTYSVQMHPATGDNLKFLLNTTVTRNKASESALANVDDDLTVVVPQVGYRGELYRATLSHDGGDAFRVTHAVPVSATAGRGIPLSTALMETRTAEQIAAEYPIAAIAGFELRYDVTVYRVSYQTQDAFGNLVAASGVVGVPVGVPAGAPLLSFQHGTITRHDHAPSINPEETGADLALYLMGARGYLVAVPDYLGFGDSTALHPFMHAKTLAWSVIDLIRAVRSLATDSGFPLNGQLFLAGYSEGGYATMAAQREIEIHHAGELVITASAPMAGAYDLSGTMLQQALTDDPLPKPMYFPYVLLAYNQIYGFDDNLANLFNESIAATVPKLFDGSNDGDTIDTALPATASDLFAPALLATLENGDYHPLKAALAHNDVYRWTPVSPTRLYHCLDDDRVPYENSTVAIDHFAAAGADVRLETLFFGNHSDCAIPALLSGNAWFDSLVALP
ncbi:MAG: prolyl oligopeptidase family serine peptidase [Burkholderiales bacterium]|uniref:prolyl oligopeptidase family serine peptidase n=1 Tax=Nitrosomonas sp. TaxID=42353 RepID=UPI001D622886|nr:prolyl oligopeptidase family serine peptidase [Nitrosomonas sp.]MCB1948163.1 prolyl oligopeptidase family serine peptidase [Nitrosomonas sp.]MCP5243144.1 prolyl oligopeptidase family serine peptidase [Burkholderiales bacterium]